MGNVCFTPICPPLSMQDLYAAHEIVPEVFTTPSALIQHLMKQARAPHMRILYCVPQGGRLEPANIGPVIPFLRQGIINCGRGLTYVLPMPSSMGKTNAAEFLMAELQGRNALYFSAAGDRDIVKTLQQTLNTTVGSALLAKCLVVALGKTGAGGDYKLPSLLIIDEVNDANDDNKAFIQDLFLGIAHNKGLTCVILTNKERVAEALIRLNSGKIRPFPGSAKKDWKPPARPEWLPHVCWTRDELQVLIRYAFRTRLGNRVENVFTEQFPADGETPGDVWGEVDLKIDKGEIN